METLRQVDRDAEDLLRRVTVAEAKAHADKIKSNIDQKKEELRQLVGERYRDLIDAADTIGQMKKATESVVANVKRMQTLCSRVSPPSAEPAPARSCSAESRVGGNAVAAQMKLMVDTPEQVWAALEARDFLRAARLFLLADSVFSQLQHKRTDTEPLVDAFPVLRGQWAAIRKFRQSILDGALGEATDVNGDADEVTRALTAIALLDAQGQQRLMDTFLALRGQAIVSLASDESSTASVCDRVCTLLRAIQATVAHALSVFNPGGDDHDHNTTNRINGVVLDESLSMLTRSLRLNSRSGHDDTATHHPSDADEDRVFPLFASQGASLHAVLRHLPAPVLHYRPMCSAAESPLAAQRVLECVQLWSVRLWDTLRPLVDSLVSRLSSVEALGVLTTAVWHAMGDGEGAVLDVWQCLVRAAVADRARQIVTRCVHETLVRVPAERLDTVLAQVCEGGSGATGHEAEAGVYDWIASSGRDEQSADHHSVADKAAGITPGVRLVLSGVEEGVVTLFDDVRHLSPERPSDHDGGNGAFDRYADGVALLRHAHSETLDALERLTAVLVERLDRHANDDAVLVVARLSAALSEHTPRTVELVSSAHARTTLPSMTTATTVGAASSPASSAIARIRSRTAAAALASSPSAALARGATGLADERLAERLSRLRDVATGAWHKWAEQYSGEVERSVAEALAGDSALLGGGALDLVHIADEATAPAGTDEEEAEQPATTTVPVPVHLSCAVSALLYDICTQLSRHCVRVAPRGVAHQLIACLGDACVRAYSAAPVPRSQDACLQWVFDLSVLQLVLAGRGAHDAAAFSTQVSALVRQCMERVDPFDVDIVTPHLRASVSRCFHRHSVLYGALYRHIPARLVPTAPPPLSTSASSDSHNAMAIAPTAPRFALLPISDAASRVAVSPPSPFLIDDTSLLSLSLSVNQ